MVLEAGRITAQGPSAEVATEHLSAFSSLQGDEAGSAASVGGTGSEIAEAGASPAAGGALGEERDGAVAEFREVLSGFFPKLESIAKKEVSPQPPTHLYACLAAV